MKIYHGLLIWGTTLEGDWTMDKRYPKEKGKYEVNFVLAKPVQKVVAIWKKEGYGHNLSVALNELSKEESKP